MRLGSLFSGAGLGDLGWMMAGFEIAWQCEVDPYCQKILDLRFPETKKYHDIRDLKNPETVDIVAGGFPCQPFSVAGQQRGDQDDRNLWPEMLRIIKRVRPAWVVGENVSGIIPLYLDTVLADLEAEGYACRTFVFPAHALGANHRRERIWIVGYSQQRRQRGKPRRRSGPKPEDGHSRLEERGGDISGDTHGRNGHKGEKRELAQRENSQPSGVCGDVPYAADAGPQGVRKRKESASEDVADTKSSKRKQFGDSRTGRAGFADSCSDASDSIQQRPQGQLEAGATPWAINGPGNGCYPGWWAAEPDVGRVAHGVSRRVDRLKALGNGQVVACTAFIGQQIMEFERIKDQSRNDVP